MCGGERSEVVWGYRAPSSGCVYGADSPHTAQKCRGGRDGGSATIERYVGTAWARRHDAFISGAQPISPRKCSWMCVCVCVFWGGTVLWIFVVLHHVQQLNCSPWFQKAGQRSCAHTCQTCTQPQTEEPTREQPRHTSAKFLLKFALWFPFVRVLRRLPLALAFLPFLLVLTSSSSDPCESQSPKLSARSWAAGQGERVAPFSAGSGGSGSRQNRRRRRRRRPPRRHWHRSRAY